MIMTRRTAASLVGLAALAACASNGTTSITTAETDLLLIDNAAIQVAIDLAPVDPVLSASLTNGVNKPLDLVKVSLTALLNGTAPPTGAMTTIQIIDILNTSLSELAPTVSMMLPNSLPYVLAAEVMLVTASSLLGIVVTPAPVSTMMQTSHIAPEEARAMLKQYLSATDGHN